MEIDSNNKIKCSNPSCNVATTGVCAEGHDPLEACPTYGHELASVPIETAEYPSSENEEPSIAKQDSDLPTGEALDSIELEKFLRCRPAIRIAIVGERDSGKTTLICSIYDEFLRGAFANHIFAGSWTLIALEKRLHLSRIDSGRAKPDTAHTSISDGLKFFHLAVNHKDTNHRSDLMLSDRAGELYKQARGNSNYVEELSEIKQSDKVVLLLDGGRVANAVERAGAIQSVRQMLRALIDGNALSITSMVQIVTTKIDLFVDHADKAIIESQLESFKQRLINDFEDKLGGLSFWDIAARAPSGNYGYAYGVDKIFSDWTVRKPRVASRSKLNMMLPSEFDLLLLRTPMEVLL